MPANSSASSGLSHRARGHSEVQRCKGRAPLPQRPDILCSIVELRLAHVRTFRLGCSGGCVPIPHVASQPWPRSRLTRGQRTRNAPATTGMAASSCANRPRSSYVSLPRRLVWQKVVFSISFLACHRLARRVRAAGAALSQEAGFVGGVRLRMRVACKDMSGDVGDHRAGQACASPH